MGIATANKQLEWVGGKVDDRLFALTDFVFLSICLACLADANGFGLCQRCQSALSWLEISDGEEMHKQAQDLGGGIRTADLLSSVIRIVGWMPATIGVQAKLANINSID